MGFRHIPYFFNYTKIRKKSIFQCPIGLFVVMSICVFGRKNMIFSFALLTTLKPIGFVVEMLILFTEWNRFFLSWASLRAQILLGGRKTEQF